MLVALMQGGGFLIASLGSYVTAFLHDVSGSFSSGWALHLIVVVSVYFLYMRFNPSRYAQVMQSPA